LLTGVTIAKAGFGFSAKVTGDETIETIGDIRRKNAFAIRSASSF
jgi:hypothetical protein